MGPPVRNDHCVKAHEWEMERNAGVSQHLCTAVGGAKSVHASVAAAEVDCAVGAHGTLRLHAAAGLKFPN